MNRWEEDFDNFENRVWLNCAHQGPLPNAAVEAAGRALELKRRPYTIDFEEFFLLPERLRTSLSRLVNAHPDEIALGNSATFGIQVLVHGIPWTSGDEILVVDGDFPTSVMPWRVLERKGVKVSFIRPEGPYLSPDDVTRHITKKTRLLCATWVSSYTGWTLDPVAIGNVTRERGVLTLLNVSQGLGAMTLDIQKLPVDALTCCGFKWLLGPYGTGFAWIDSRLVDRLEQYQAYWQAMVYPDMRPPDLSYDIKRPEGARAFDVFGTANFLNFMTWQASVDYLVDQGLDAVARFDRRLIDRLTAGIDSMNLVMVSPPSASDRSAIVVFAHPDEGQNERLHRHLSDDGFDVSIRGGQLRVSPHLYNTPEQIDAFLEALSEGIDTQEAR